VHGHWAELVSWADIIDSAAFASAEEAVALAEPALEVMTWLEHNRDSALTHRLIRSLGHMALADIANEPWVRDPLAAVLDAHERHVTHIERRSRQDRGVVFFDLTDDGIETHNKFIAYMLHPTARFTVGLTRSAKRVKVSVGYNPWSDVPCPTNVATICERYGGGGHPVVGAIALPGSQIARARAIAVEISEELRGLPASQR
jgi:hypothetical protein